MLAFDDGFRVKSNSIVRCVTAQYSMAQCECVLFRHNELWNSVVEQPACLAAAVAMALSWQASGAACGERGCNGIVLCLQGCGRVGPGAVTPCRRPLRERQLRWTSQQTLDGQVR